VSPGSDRNLRVSASANRVTIISDYFYFNRLYAIIYDYCRLFTIIYDYFIGKSQTIILHYCIISKKTIISLISLRSFHLYFSGHIIAIIAIMCIIFIENYYIYYSIRDVL
jgi:hypothetical protein